MRDMFEDTGAAMELNIAGPADGAIYVSAERIAVLVRGSAVRQQEHAVRKCAGAQLALHVI